MNFDLGSIFLGVMLGIIATGAIFIALAHYEFGPRDDEDFDDAF